MALCQCCSRTIAEKDGVNGKVAAAARSSEREQMGGGDSTKVEAAKRRGQDQHEERGNAAEICTLLNGSARLMRRESQT